MAILAVRTISSIFTMINGYPAALSKLDDITDLCSSIINRSDTLYIVIVLESIHNDLKSLDIGIHLRTLLLQSLECRPCRDLDLSTVGKNECHIVCTACVVYIKEHRITIGTRISLRALRTCSSCLALRTLLTLRTLRTSSRSYLYPSSAVIIRHIPHVILDPELWGNAILSIRTVLTWCAGLTILTI